MTGGIIWLLFCSSENQNWGHNTVPNKTDGAKYERETENVETVA